MRITQVIQEFSRNGGAEVVAYELQEAWRKSGIDSRVVTGTTSDSNEKRTDVTVLSSPVSNLATRGKFAKYLGRPFVIPTFTMLATAFVNKNAKQDVILSHGDTFIGDVMIIHAVNKASLQQKVKDGNYRWMLNPMHWWVGARDRFMIGGCRYKFYVALSGRIKQEIMDLYKVPSDRIAVISNGVNIQRFTTEGSGLIEIRKEFNIPSNAKVLLFVGHEFERKGLGFIIDAMKQLSRDTYLLVVGNDEKAQYEKQASANNLGKRVIFTGPRRDLPDIYRAVDAFVLPTNYEAFALVAMEALASGVPIFATAVGGIEDYLIEGVNGRFIERDPEDIANKINSVFSNPELVASMKVAARSKALEYTWDKIADQYMVLFRRVYASKAKAKYVKAMV